MRKTQRLVAGTAALMVLPAIGLGTATSAAAAARWHDGGGTVPKGASGFTSADKPAGGKGVRAANTRGVKLTTGQATALKKAYGANKNLTSEQARKVIAKYGPGIPDEGEDSSKGKCSWMKLWGDSDGRYNFTQGIRASHGVALFGELNISTNAPVGADLDRFVPTGRYQHYEDQLWSAGIGGTATTMIGWLYTSAGYVCFGYLRAVWD
jgi:hypothetical protein